MGYIDVRISKYDAISLSYANQSIIDREGN